MESTNVSICEEDDSSQNSYKQNLNWRPISQAPENTWLLCRGPSGYKSTPYRYLVTCKDNEFRPRQPWVTIGNNSILDDGPMITEWTDLPAE